MPGLTDYAQLAGLTLLAGRAQRERAQMAMLDDRDRIARNMHDHVIHVSSRPATGALENGCELVVPGRRRRSAGPRSRTPCLVPGDDGHHPVLTRPEGGSR
jgi:hypothetical protein